MNVNTTIGLVMLGGIGLVLTAVVEDFARLLWLDRTAITGLQVWRLVTWIVPNQASGWFWTLILLYLVYTFGSLLENQVGRQGMLRLTVALTIVPAVVFCLVAILTGSNDRVTGLNVIELGLLVAFAAQFPWVRFFFGIPGPVMVGIFVALEIWQSRGSLPRLALVLSGVAMALLGIRAMGYAQDAHKIPRLSIPGLTPSHAAGSQPNLSRFSAPKRNKDSGSRSGKAGTGTPKLRSVPTGSAPRRPNAASMPEIDAILDQISESGFESLDDAQKKALNQYSQRLRKDRDS